VELVAVAEVGQRVARPLVSFGQQDCAGVVIIHEAPETLAVLVRFGQVLAVGAFTLKEIGHGVNAEAVHAQIQPVLDHVQHGLLHRRIVVVEIGLAAVEAVPVVLLAEGIEGPVGAFRIEEDDAGVGVTLGGVAPHVIVPQTRLARLAGQAKPGMLVRGVVHDQVGDDPHPAPVHLIDDQPELLYRPIVGMDAVEAGDVITVVPQGRRIDGRDPDAVDPQPFQVIQALQDTGEVSPAVAVAIGEGAGVKLIEDGVGVPGHAYDIPSQKNTGTSSSAGER